MKAAVSLAVAWVSFFSGGYALGSHANRLTYDSYYYCAAREDTCQGSGWYYWETINVQCCCDLNADQIWHVCDATIDVYVDAQPPYNSYFCYRLVGGPTENPTTCVPAPVAIEPIEPAIYSPLDPCPSCKFLPADTSRQMVSGAGAS